jgi:hypothetical protein
MPRLAVVVVAAVGLVGCGSAARLAAAPPHSRSSGPLLGFSVRQTAEPLTGLQVALRPRTVGMAVTSSRVASVSCRLGAPLRPVGIVAPGLLAHWTSLLNAARLQTIRSDPPGPGRVYWFSYRGREVRVQFDRHMHRAPCVATQCMAMMRIDATLRAVLPAATALSGFIAAHCPVA